MMTKVILKGRKGCFYDLGINNIPAGQVIDLCASELKEAEKDNLIEEYIDKKPIKKTPTKAYTEKEFFDMNKDEQVKRIEKLGLKPASKEADRVKQLLEAQK